VLWVSYLLRKGPTPAPLPVTVPDSTLRELLGQALPISVTRIIGSVTEFLDAAIIPRRLEASGMTRDAATAFFGNLGGMAMPLLFFPTVITAALSQALVPAVSDAWARGDVALVRRRIAQSLYVALIVALPTSAVFIVMGHLLGILFYGQRQVGDLLIPLAFAAPFVYLESGVSAVLRGLGRAALAMTNGLVGSALRLVIVYTLTVLPGFGIRAVILAISVDLFISFWLNYRALCRVTGFAADLRRIVMPPLVAGLALFLSLRFLEDLAMRFGATLWVATLAAIGCGGLIYLLLLLLLGGGRRSFNTL
jgi:stage V sporulation protein B